MTRVLLRLGRDCQMNVCSSSRRRRRSGLLGFLRREERMEVEVVRGEEGVEGGLVLIGVDEVGSCLSAFDGEGCPIIGQCSFLGSVECA